MIGWARQLVRWGNQARATLSGPVVLIGHSHTKVVFEAAAEAGFPLRGFNFWTAPQPALNPERTALHPEIASGLAKGTVFSFVAGTTYNMLAMVKHPRPFDFALPDRPDLPLEPQTEVLPFDAVRDTVREALGEYLQIIDLIRAAATGRVLHIESPPPLEDGARMELDVPWMFFPDLTREVAPAALRLKAWRLQADLMGAFCHERGIEVLPPPPAATDARGFLKPEYYGDAMHVNARYGALVLKQMRRAL